MQVMMIAWRQLVTRRELEAEQTEVARLRNLVGKKSESLWDMRKDDLVEAARKELGMTRTQAETETVTTLRERIRAFREAQKVDENPDAQAPKGLNSMKTADLVEEMRRRSIPLPEKNTRPKMILLIRQHVDQCKNEREAVDRTAGAIGSMEDVTPVNQRRRQAE